LWINGGWGSLIEALAFSNAKQLSRCVPESLCQCQIREVTAISYGWPDASFKRPSPGQTYKITSFPSIWWKFSAKLNNYSGPSNCTSTPSSSVNAAFGVSFPNNTLYDIEVLIYNGENNDLNGNPNDNIYWSNYNSVNQTCNGVSKDTAGVVCETLLHGNKLGFPVLNTSAYQSYAINMRSLITSGQYLPQPPAGYTWNDAMIRYAEVYVTVRGADLSAYVKNADVTN
jgi:hypothetical protein